MNGRVDTHATLETLAKAAAETIVALLSQSVRDRGRAMIALSGGSTPRSVYGLLSAEPLRSKVPWKDVHLFWGDERCVPPESPESNFRMVNEVLLQHIQVPPHNIHRIMAERSPAEAARLYENEIRRTFRIKQPFLPCFDVILLGLGNDGHTASLFPGTSALKEQQKLVTDVYIDTLKTHRITMTFPVINNSYQVLFLVSGKGKAAILREVLHGSSIVYPAQHVRTVSGELRWLVDQDAASRLEVVNQP